VMVTAKLSEFVASLHYEDGPSDLLERIRLKNEQVLGVAANVQSDLKNAL